MGTKSSKRQRSYWIPGSYAPSIVREAQLLFKAIEKEGLKGGKGDNNWVVRHRQIPRPWNPTRAFSGCPSLGPLIGHAPRCRPSTTSALPTCGAAVFCP